MKILSVTKEEGRVIELTYDEWKEFLILSQSIEGKTENETRWDFQNMGFGEHRVSTGQTIDYSGVFGAIQAFYEARFRSNELDKLAIEFHDLMSTKAGRKV